VLEHRAAREAHRGEEAAEARQYWEHRKHQLGITRNVPHELALERIAEARQYALTHAPRQRSPLTLGHEALGIQQHVTALEHHREQLTAALAVERVYTRLGRTIPERTAQRHDALLSEGQALGISRAPQPSTSLLQDREQARARQANRERSSPAITKAKDILRRLSVEDEVTGQGLQVRLREREHEHERDRGEDRGMSW
jgi:hypothetical protein